MKPVPSSLFAAFALNGLLASAIGGCAGSAATDGVRWIVNPTLDGVLLIHGRAGSDDVDYSFLCRAGRLHLRYAMADAAEPYGTVRQTQVTLALGGRNHLLPADAIFDEGGSPLIDAVIDDPASLIRDMKAARTIATIDPWGSYAAPAPAAASLSDFAERCAIPLR